MAQKVSVLLIDDVSGGDATRTVQFGLDGVNYEIDLNEKNAEELTNSISRFIEKARRVGSAPARGRSTTRRPASTGPDAGKVRKWAAMNSIEVNERGRIPKEIIERYEAANGKAPQEPAKTAEEPLEAPQKAQEPAADPKAGKTTKAPQKAAEKVKEKGDAGAK